MRKTITGTGGMLLLQTLKDAAKDRPNETGRR